MIFQLALYQLKVYPGFAGLMLHAVVTWKCKTLREITVVVVRPGRGFVSQQPSVEGERQWSVGQRLACRSPLKGMVTFTLQPHPLTMCFHKALYAPRLQFYRNLFQPNSKKPKTKQNKVSLVTSNHPGSSLSSPGWLAEATKPVTHFKFAGH